MTIQCEYCGKSASSIRALTGTPCTRHPLGSCKGNHKLYEGSEKPIYTCKYCGRTEKVSPSLPIPLVADTQAVSPKGNMPRVCEF